jgi:Flp pilus assembly protein TadB
VHVAPRDLLVDAGQEPTGSRVPVAFAACRYRLHRVHNTDDRSAPRSRDLRPWCRGRPSRSLNLEKGVDDMRLPDMLQSPERDVLLVSALISIVVVLAFTDWGVLAYVVTGLVFAVLLLASAMANRRHRATHR